MTDAEHDEIKDRIAQFANGAQEIVMTAIEQIEEESLRRRVADPIINNGLVLALLGCAVNYSVMHAGKGSVPRLREWLTSNLLIILKQVEQNELIGEAQGNA